jgi:predicted nucleotidyltransferase
MDLKSHAKEFKDEILKKHKSRITSIVLFGSVARNEARKDSDIDILIITKSKKLDLMEDVSEISFSELLNHKVFISAKVFGLKEWNRLKRLKTPFVKNVLKDGEFLYGKF